jgi:glycosyltransferase involved in cell wall biosynthesis
MKILMVVAYFFPEIGSAAHVYLDLARAFARKGHDVDIITSYPRKYNCGNMDLKRVFPSDEEFEGIQVHRVKHPHTRDNLIIRGLEHFLLTYYYFKKYRQLNKKFDVCLMYIPPLPLYYLAKKIKKFDGTPTVLNFQDFHPQELTDVGVLKNPILIKILEHIERQAYRNADFITVLSPAGVDYIIQRGGNPEKIVHIYNGVILSDIDTLFTSRNFKEHEGIQGKFLISYAGILSPFQGIDKILDVATDLKEYKDIIFYIVGDGMIKTHLETRINNENLENVRLLPLQPRDEYYNIINSSDINLISLDDRMNAPCLPGKTSNILAANKPLIAIAGKTSETYRVIKQIYPGFVVEPNNPEEFKRIIINIKDNPERAKRMANNCRKFFEENMALEKTTDNYIKIFMSLIKN